MTPVFGRRLLRAACWVVIAPFGILAFVGALSCFVLGAFLGLMIDCFSAGRSYNGR